MTSHRTSVPDIESFVVSLAAGATAALIGVVSFWVFHTLWILNIPMVLLEGLFHAIPATFAVAWAIRKTRRAGRFRGGFRDGLVLGFLFWLTLVPYEVVGAVWGPLGRSREPWGRAGAALARVLGFAGGSRDSMGHRRGIPNLHPGPVDYDKRPIHTLLVRGGPPSVRALGI